MAPLHFIQTSSIQLATPRLHHASPQPQLSTSLPHPTSNLNSPFPPPRVCSASQTRKHLTLFSTLAATYSRHQAANIAVVVTFKVSRETFWALPSHRQPSHSLSHVCFSGAKSFHCCFISKRWDATENLYACKSSCRALTSSTNETNQKKRFQAAIEEQYDYLVQNHMATPDWTPSAKNTGNIISLQTKQIYRGRLWFQACKEKVRKLNMIYSTTDRDHVRVPNTLQ